MSLETLVSELVDARLKALGVLQPETPASIRTKAGYATVDQLATAVGIPASTLRKYEQGRCHHWTGASFDNFKRIADVCGVTAQVYAQACQAAKEAT